MRLIVAQHAAAPVQRDGRLIALLIKAHAARKQLIDAEGSIDASFSPSHVARMARLAFLAPDIVAAILDGTQPPSLTARRLLRAPEMPFCRSEEHTSELQSLMRISYAVFCLKKKNTQTRQKQS